MSWDLLAAAVVALWPVWLIAVLFVVGSLIGRVIGAEASAHDKTRGTGSWR